MMLNLPRPVRAVELPGGATVHVRDLSLADLRVIDCRAAVEPDGPERAIRAALLLCGTALCDAAGTRLFPALTDEELFGLECLTPGQMAAIAAAAVPSKDAAKNG